MTVVDVVVVDGRHGDVVVVNGGRVSYTAFGTAYLVRTITALADRLTVV